MTDNHTQGDDELITRLAGLATPAPADLLDDLFLRWTSAPSLVGPVRLALTATGACLVRTVDSMPEDTFLEACRRRFGRPLRSTDAAPPDIAAALHTGNDIARPALDLEQVAEFQRDVLAATMTIPLGETRPYSWVAAAAGRPRAVRAAGTALATNPLPLLIPCHRVVRRDGDPGQYIFGAAAKRELLRREGEQAGAGQE